jgi:hypothetical protein
LRTLPGQRGVDARVLDGPKPFGKDYLEIKPRTPSGLRSYGRQVDKWGYDSNSVGAITYDANGYFYNGFF